jgi:hypothetical protein
MGIGHDTRLPRMTIYKVLRYLGKAGLLHPYGRLGWFLWALSHESYSSRVVHPFVIVVADRDATVGVVSSMLLKHQNYRKKFVE